VQTFKWNEDLKVGIKKFDIGHKHLFKLLQSAYDNLAGNSSVEDLGCALKAFVDYATDHFNAEERWMKVNNYPKFAGHLNLHGGFMTRMVEIQFDFIEGRNTLSAGTLNFLKYWLTSHIHTADSDYGRFAANIHLQSGPNIQFKERCGSVCTQQLSYARSFDPDICFPQIR